MIKPTVGRMVLFMPSKRDPMLQMGGYNPPFAAQIAYVWSDSIVNLMVTSPEGQPEPRTSVQLVQGDEPKPDGAYCEWIGNAVQWEAPPAPPPDHPPPPPEPAETEQPASGAV